MTAHRVKSALGATSARYTKAGRRSMSAQDARIRLHDSNDRTVRPVRHHRASPTKMKTISTSSSTRPLLQLSTSKSPRAQSGRNGNRRSIVRRGRIASTAKNVRKNPNKASVVRDATMAIAAARAGAAGNSIAIDRVPRSPERRARSNKCIRLRASRKRRRLKGLPKRCPLRRGGRRADQ